MKNILCFGDSNTWGFDYDTRMPLIGAAKRYEYHERWTGVMQKALGADYHVIEDALCGRTIMLEDPFCPDRKGLTSLNVALEAHSPLDLVIIQLGANDIQGFFGISAKKVALSLVPLINLAKNSYNGYEPPKVMIIAPAPARANVADLASGHNYDNGAYEKSLEFGKYYEPLAKDHGCYYFDCASLDFELNDVDGLHYSRNDCKKLGEAIAEMVKGIL